MNGLTEEEFELAEAVDSKEFRDQLLEIFLEVYPTIHSPWIHLSEELGRRPTPTELDAALKVCAEQYRDKVVALYRQQIQAMEITGERSKK